MHEQHTATVAIYAHDGDPAGTSPVVVRTETDKREEGHHNTATLSITARHAQYPQKIDAVMTAGEWETLALACQQQASILRGGVGR